MGTVEYLTAHSFERRIGRRVTVRPVDVQWSVPFPRSGGDEQRGTEQAGRIVELSITGATISGPADLPVEVGEEARVRWEGGGSAVVVRHIARSLDGSTRYGVELATADPTLARLVAEGGAVADRGRSTSGAPAGVSGAPDVLDLTEGAPVVERGGAAGPASPAASAGRSILDEVFGLMQG